MLGEVKRNKLFFSTVTIGLFLSFAFNVLGAVSLDSFKHDYKDSEALVSNQVICKGDVFSNQLVATGGELGPGTSSIVEDCSSSNLVAYTSHFGLQGKYFSFVYNSIDSALGGIGTQVYIILAQLLMAVLSAITFALLALWIKRKYGLYTGLFVALCVALSPMLVGFGRNLYWVLPTMVLPFIYMLYYYKSDRVGHGNVLFWAVLTALLYIRFLSGYEYVTTLTIMVFTVVVYNLYLSQSKTKEYIRQATIVLVVSLMAFGGAMVTHVATLAEHKGSVEAAIKTLSQRAEERTVSAEGYTVYPYQNLTRVAPGLVSTVSSYGDYEKASNSGSLLGAITVNGLAYLLLPVINIPFEFNPSFGLYLQSTALFLLGLMGLFVTRKKWSSRARLREVEALYTGVGVGLVGYMSWLILAFSHSLVHAHINGILLYLPAALFGFVVYALFTEQLIRKYKMLGRK